jgi:hypothetical protein
MTDISPGDKFTSIADASADYLLDLDGQVMALESGFWIKFSARRVPASPERPAGIDYSLCLFGPGDERLLCYDNAHPVWEGTGPGARKSKTNDHVHRGDRIRPYAYANAAALLEAFWNDVNRILDERSAP